ncbi:glycosyltransferase, partial [Streptomyces fungicidicus]
TRCRRASSASPWALTIAEVRAAGPAPRTAAPAAHHYSISHSTARLMDVYAAAVARTAP